jgi:uncharacterized protein YraI
MMINSKRATILLIALGLLSASTACSVALVGNETPAATPTIGLITATLPPTQTPHPSGTPIPPTPTITVQPVAGVTTTQVNVRGEPSLDAAVLGVIAATQTVQIIGQDNTRKWWMIQYDKGPDGLGWITAEFVRAPFNIDVPVIGGPAETDTPTATAAAASLTPTGKSATLTDQVNVRNGPGTTFDSLGILNAQQTVYLTGKNATGTWLQIQYPNGPDGTGWISAAYAQVEGVDELPILDESGAVLGTGTPTTSGPTPTPTIVPAPADGDTMENPVATATFSPSGSRSFSYNGDVSSPEGDPEDWIQFTPYAPQSGQAVTLYVSLTCAGNGRITVDLWQGGSKLLEWGKLNCGDSEKQLVLTSGLPYLFRLTIIKSSKLTYLNYTLTVRTGP